jgi:hypothetical protein
MNIMKKNDFFSYSQNMRVQGFIFIPNNDQKELTTIHVK